MRRFFLKSCVVILLLVATSSWAGVDFDKVDDLMSESGGSYLEDLPAADFSGSAWIYAESAGASNFGRIMSKRPADFNGGWLYYVTTTATIAFATIDSGGSIEAQYVADNNECSLNTWHHVAFTYDQSAKTAKLYIDGSEVSGYQTATAGTTDAGADGTSGFTLGNIRTGIRAFEGQINEVALWTTELTATQVAQLANSRLKGVPTQVAPANLVVYWALDDEEDGTSADGDTFRNFLDTVPTLTGNDGANNTGLTAKAETVLSYPQQTIAGQ